MPIFQLHIIKNRPLYDYQVKNRILRDNISMENKNIMEIIQTRLRLSIKQSNYTQKEIANAIGVSEKTISKYMKHDIFPALDTLAKICKFLDVSSDYILGITDY